MPVTPLHEHNIRNVLPRADIVVQLVNPELAAMFSQLKVGVPAALHSVHLPDHATEDSSHLWVPASNLGDLNGILGSLIFFFYLSQP